MSQRKPALKFAVCISNEDYEASLELHKIYRVVPDDDAAVDGDIRVIDESGEDYLYPADWFVFIEIPRSLERSLSQAAWVQQRHPTSAWSGLARTVLLFVVTWASRSSAALGSGSSGVA
jgi:hypothetical protein